MSQRNPMLLGLGLVVLGLCTAPTGSAADWQQTEAGRAFLQRQSILRSQGQPVGPSKALTDRVFSDGGFESPNPCLEDRDSDGLADCVETLTGHFIDISDTGTDPDNPDSDSDGLLDGEEVLGSETGLDLPAMGVSPLRRDILLEYDWFESDYSCGPHSQRPTVAAIERLADMFASAPVQNPDGSFGIHLVQDYGQGGLYQGGNRIDGYHPVLPGALDATFYEIKQANFDPARLGYFRYVMLPHQYNGGSFSSGYAEVVGDDAIVALQCFNNDDYLARTMAHELGHLLGLLHGGFEWCNHKPNYNSLMNYRYQFAGIDHDCDAQGDPLGDDFSIGARVLLNESELSETAGVCGAQPVDWNGDGTLDEQLEYDLNPTGGCSGTFSMLHDFDDWTNLTFAGLADRTGALKSVQSEVGCAGAPPSPTHKAR
ncbi:hypothetical protein [Pseudomarimonas arenosa]|uniref:Peptidase M43 pregnancy-associated plasma-A domain-containing protein n=1 Tax=Pseudomarimonas arenosa TaxID=2774145 RepID=A0AAW3ZHE3_9GAMM|nr:hypothetical protein [Pseudomarimonas arenosa]MBD8525218.1 hypothetical protein [Pseudomarimonas arenosa]